MGRTSKSLEHSAPGSKVLEGKSFPASASASELEKWVGDLGL